MATERRKSTVNLCGWCAGSPMARGGPEHGHKRCYSPDSHPCACAAAEHKPTPKTAAVMARYCHCTVDQVYAAHGQGRAEQRLRKRRVVSDEQRAVLAERLKAARSAKGTKA